MTVQTFEKWWRKQCADHTLDGASRTEARIVWEAAHENAAKACEAERLTDALDTPDDIAYNNAVRDCADAIREAVLANVRSWRYIAKILARWSKDGRGDATPTTPGTEIDVTRYTDGAYGDLFRRGSDVSDLEPLP